MDFTISCLCGCPGGSNLLSVTNGTLSYWRQACSNYSDITCPDCGCKFNLSDGTTQINTQDVSQPKITSISQTSGSITGGTVITVTGHSLNIGTLNVKFDEVNGTNVRSRTATSAMVDTPAGKIKLNTQGTIWRKLLISGTSGTFQVNETITGQSSGKTATIKEIQSTYLMVTAWSGEFSSETITGQTSAATATAGTFNTSFQNSETVTGVTSGNSGVLCSVSPLKVSSLNNNFSANEFILGSTTGCKVQLSSSPISGLVNVCVTNEHGKRVSNSTLTNGFNYTV